MDLSAALDAVVSVAGEREEQSVLERTVDLARVLAGARYGLALLLGPDGTPSAVAHQGMTTREVAALPRLPRPVGLFATVLSGSTVRLDRAEDAPQAVGLPAGHVPMAAFLGAPIVADGRVLGGLYLTQPPGQPAFTDVDEVVAGALARQAGSVVAGLRRLESSETVLDGLRLTADRSGDRPSPPDGSSPVIQRLLSVARASLGMELTFLSRIDADRQVFTHVDRDERADALALAPGTAVEPHEGYCSLMLDGAIPTAVPDVAAHPVLSGMDVTIGLGVGAYCGVPVHLPDGQLFGTLCALDGAAQSAPRPGQVEALRTIARLVGDRLAYEQQAADGRRQRRLAFAPVLDGALRSLVLQPIVDLATGETVGYEALSRFTDPAGGPRRADQVFAEAAELGLGVRLEQAAARTALRLLPHLPEGTYLSVNLSPQAVLDPATFDLLTGAPLHRLVLELTEHDQVADYDALLRAVAGLRERGLRLAVDDAGAGFTSLQHITRLAPDVIKLDIEFVRGVDRDPTRRAVARAMCSFAAELGAVLVAEGIETSAELAQLRALGAPVGQGYHLGRPVPPAVLFGGTGAGAGRVA